MKLQELWRKCQLLLIIAFGTYPLVMLLLDYFKADILAFGPVFSLVYVLLSLLGLQVKGKWRLSAGIGMSLCFAAAVFVVAPQHSRLGAVLAAVLCSGLLIWSLKIAGWSHKQEIPVSWIAAGVVIHLLGQVRLHADRVAGGQGLSRYSGWFLMALFGFVLLTLLSMNRSGLTAASGKRQSVPGTMRRKNSMLILMLFVIAIFASLLPSAMSSLTDVMEQMLDWIVDFVMDLIPDVNHMQNDDIYTQNEPLGPVLQDQGGTFALNPIVEKLMAACGAVITFVLLALLFYRMYRILAGKLRSLVASLGKFASNVSEDYIDEVTDTREDGTAEKTRRIQSGSRKLLREPRNLPPDQRIRFRYQWMMHRHPEWEAGSTAREKLPGRMADLYERVRYGHYPTTEEEAAEFAAESKKI